MRSHDHSIFGDLCLLGGSAAVLLTSLGGCRHNGALQNATLPPAPGGIHREMEKSVFLNSPEIFDVARAALKLGRGQGKSGAQSAGSRFLDKWHAEKGMIEVAASLDQTTFPHGFFIRPLVEDSWTESSRWVLVGDRGEKIGLVFPQMEILFPSSVTAGSRSPAFFLLQGILKLLPGEFRGIALVVENAEARQSDEVPFYQIVGSEDDFVQPVR